MPDSFAVAAAKLLLKGLAGLIVLGILAISGLLAWYLLVLPPDAPVPNLRIERTAARISRGEYLATAVLGCIYCHSERDWTLFGAPPKPGTFGKGGERFDQSMGLSGVVIAPNITPHHLGDWSDGEIYRAITSGLHKDGYALFPLMPWDVYTWLDTEDVYGIIAYLRTLPPIASEWTGRKPSLLMRIIANSRVRPAEPWAVNRTNPVAYGEYLAVLAGCRFCHTPPGKGLPWNQENSGQFFAGGRGVPRSGLVVYSANITPDTRTGIGNWTAMDFIRRFTEYRGARIPVGEKGYNTEHAWTEYAKMSDEDLIAIYTYLMTQPPISNKVNEDLEERAAEKLNADKALQGAPPSR